MGEELVKRGSTMDLQVQATGTKVIQVTNIAPQATRDQMHTLFSFLGKIEDLRLYPSLRDASVTIQSRCCFLKFLDEGVLPISLHMTNTVFIDRAIIVHPFMITIFPMNFLVSSSQIKLPGTSQERIGLKNIL